ATGAVGWSTRARARWNQTTAAARSPTTNSRSSSPVRPSKETSRDRSGTPESRGAHQPPRARGGPDFPARQRQRDHHLDDDPDTERPAQPARAGAPALREFGMWNLEFGMRVARAPRRCLQHRRRRVADASKNEGPAPQKRAPLD